MKKNKKRTYKKLPKYALGTMKPIDLGYQRGLGIGGAHLEVLQGISLEPETQAMKANRIPLAMSLVSAFAPYITLMATNFGSNAASTASTSLFNQVNNVANTTRNIVSNAVSGTAGAFGTAATNAANVGGAIGTTLGSSTAGGVTANLGKLAEEAAKNAATFGGTNTAANAGNTANAGSGALGTVGTALGVLGSAYGLTNMGMQIADFGSHRSASDMLANSGKQFFTTDKGNQYQTYTGVNTGQETAYEKAAARSKQLGFGINSIGTGASLGGLIGGATTAGSVGGPLGMAIGAGVGLLLGGLGSLFGWGDNSEEVERLARITNDNISMYNRLNEAVAKSKDVAAEFNDRQGVATASEGKNAYGPMNAKSGDNINTPKLLFDVNSNNNMSVGIPTSKLMPGETVFDKETLNWAVVPGKGNKDNVYSTVKPGDSKAVFTNKDGISKLGAAVLKSNAPEDLKRWLLNELEKKQAALLESENNQSDMKKYKNGKLPGFWRGTDYLMSAIPHIAALGSSWNLYNRAKYADMPDYPNIVDSSANTEAINILGRRRFDPEPILNMLNDQHRHALYDLHRMPGLTAGGQAVAMANQNIKTSRAKAEALAQADEINNRYTADYANALANYGKWMSEMMTNNNYARTAFKQQQNAAKEGWMAQYEKNGLTALADLAKDVMGVRQFGRSEDYQNQMLKLYGQQVENDKNNALAALAQAKQARLDRESAYRNTVKDAAEKASPMFFNQGLFGTPSLYNMYGELNNIPQLTYPRMKYHSWMGK